MAPGKQWKFVEAEAWQMGLYGPGGHYLPHYDAFDSNLLPPDVWGADRLWVGNRIATVMFYLSNLVGGSTAFPKLGIASSTSKGSAVFWNNLHKDVYQTLQDTEHYAERNKMKIQAGAELCQAQHSLS